MPSSSATKEKTGAHPPTGGPRSPRAGRRLRRATVLSLLIHVALALVFLVAPGEKEEIGSDHVDIDLVAPRLAAPQRLNQQKGEAAARAARGDPASEEPTGGASATDADALALMASADRRDDDSSERSPWVVPAPVVAEQQSAGQQSADPDAEQRVDTAQTTRADRQRQQREQRAAAAKKQRARAKDPRIAQPGGPDRAARSASSSAEARAKARPSDRGDRAAPNDDTDRPRQVVRKKTTELAARGQPTAMEARLTEIDADQPAEVDPTRLLAAVESERDRRRIAVERWRAEHSRRERRAAARFALMTGRRGTSGARGSGPGAPAAGTTSRARAGRGERRARGRAAVDASGRQVDGPPGGLRYG